MLDHFINGFISVNGTITDYLVVAASYPFSGCGCNLIKGKVVEEFGFISIEVAELYRLPNENMEEPSTRLKVPDKKKVLQSNNSENSQILKFRNG